LRRGELVCDFRQTRRRLPIHIGLALRETVDVFLSLHRANDATREGDVSELLSK